MSGGGKRKRGSGKTEEQIANEKPWMVFGEGGYRYGAGHPKAGEKVYWQTGRPATWAWATLLGDRGMATRDRPQATDVSTPGASPPDASK